MFPVWMGVAEEVRAFRRDGVGVVEEGGFGIYFLELALNTILLGLVERVVEFELHPWHNLLRGMNKAE